VDVEKTIGFILAQQARNEAHLAAMDERHDRAMPEQNDFIQQQNVASQRHDREMQQIREQLRRAVRLAVQDARHDRKRRREMAEQWDQKITQLSAAQLVTEEKLQGLLEAMRRSNNGHS
jgi:hypothetical protein